MTTQVKARRKRPASVVTRWREFFKGFRALADTDSAALETSPTGHWIGVRRARGFMETWTLSQGPNDDIRARFEALAAQAAVELGAPPGVPALQFWLDRVLQFGKTEPFLRVLWPPYPPGIPPVHDCRQSSGRSLFAVSDKGEIINSVHAVSADFCSHLAKGTWKTQLAPPQRMKEPRANWYESSPDVVKRRQIVLRNPKLPGASFVKLFDRERIPLPSTWEKKLGVTSWVEAYKNRHTRGLIQKMISTDRQKA